MGLYNACLSIYAIYIHTYILYNYIKRDTRRHAERLGQKERKTERRNLFHSSSKILLLFFKHIIAFNFLLKNLQ